MKHLYLILFLFIANIACADSLDVTGYKQIPNDISASRYPRLDANDNPCALIKVLSALEGLGFESNLGIVGDIEKKQGEYWLYVSPGERRLSLWGVGYMRYNFNLPVPAQSGKVYQMIVVPKGVSDGGIATGYLLLKSKPAGAKVWIDNEYMGVTPYQSEMTAGYHDFRLEKEMYYPKEGGFTIRLDETSTEEATLVPNFGGLTITTTPIDGAAIILDGKPTDFVTPHTFEMLSSNEHTIGLSIDLYEPESRQVNILDNETASLNIPLIPVFGNVSITTEPVAAIFIDEQQVGTGSYNDILKKGVHTIEARLDKYYTQSRKLAMKAGANETIGFKLDPITGKLSVETTPPEANIIINGVTYGKSPRMVPDLLIGTYEIELRKENYATVKKSFEIKENERTNISENLDNFTEITIKSSPSGANLTLNGKNEGTTSKTLTTNLGRNKIKLTRSGYNDFEDTFTVSEQQSTYNFTLVSDQKAMAQMDFNKYKKQKNIWMAATAVAAGTGAYFMYSSDKAGEDYETATTEATSLYDKMERLRTISFAAFGVSGVCAIFAILNTTKQSKAKKKINIAAVPVDGGGMLSLQVKF